MLKRLNAFARSALGEISTLRENCPPNKKAQLPANINNTKALLIMQIITKF